MIYDISPTIDESLGVWPGDTRPTREVLQQIAKGDPVNLSTLRTTVHLGAHVDAPYHYDQGGRTIDQQPLDLYIGHCRVLRGLDTDGNCLLPTPLPDEIGAERVLLATGTHSDRTAIGDGFMGCSVELIHELAQRGVRLVGIDTPSVDPFDSPDLGAHRACLRHDIAILEGLVLDEVPEGEYELIALPLRLAGADGSPVRAILRC